jgi:hypothetical protein
LRYTKEKDPDRVFFCEKYFYTRKNDFSQKKTICEIILILQKNKEEIRPGLPGRYAPRWPSCPLWPL